MLSKDVKISSAITPTAGAAGTTDIEGAGLDMANFEGVLMLVRAGVLTTGGTCTIKAQQSDDDGSSDAYSDLEGTLQTLDVDADDEKTFFINVHRPQKRYVRLYVDRGTQNAVISSAHYLQYGPRVKPTTHGTNVSGESFASPDEGTA